MADVLHVVRHKELIGAGLNRIPDLGRSEIVNLKNGKSQRVFIIPEYYPTTATLVYIPVSEIESFA
jgi:hypothetical protein